MTIYGRSLPNSFLQSPTYSRRTMPHAMGLGGQISGKRKMIFQLVFRVAPTKPRLKYNRKCVESYKNKSSTTNR